MGLETRKCTCGLEFEDSEWSRSELCDECRRPARRPNILLDQLTSQYEQFTDDYYRFLPRIPQTPIRYVDLGLNPWDTQTTIGTTIQTPHRYLGEEPVGR